MNDLEERIEELENVDNTGVPVGTVAFFNLENCPDDTWQNVTELGWGGQFFRVADTSNPRNTPQEQSIQSHVHTVTLKKSDKKASWDDGYRNIFTTGTRNPVNTTDVVRGGSPYVSQVKETRPKNIPLTTCVKIR